MNTLYSKCVIFEIDNFHKFYKDSFEAASGLAAGGLHLYEQTVLLIPSLKCPKITLVKEITFSVSIK